MEQAAYHGEPCEFSRSCDAVRIRCAGTARPRAGTQFPSPDVAHQLARREDAMYTRVPVEVDRPGSGGRMIWRGSRVRPARGRAEARHELTPMEALRGLSSSEAAAKLRQYGPNQGRLRGYYVLIPWGGLRSGQRSSLGGVCRRAAGPRLPGRPEHPDRVPVVGRTV